MPREIPGSAWSQRPKVNKRIRHAKPARLTEAEVAALRASLTCVVCSAPFGSPRKKHAKYCPVPWNKEGVDDVEHAAA